MADPIDSWPEPTPFASSLSQSPLTPTSEEDGLAAEWRHLRDDWNQLVIKLQPHMSSLVNSLECRDFLTSLEIRHYGQNTVPITQEFLGSIAADNPGLQSGIVKFLRRPPAVPRVETNDAELRAKLKPVEQAIYQPNPRLFVPCLTGTRTAIIQGILDEITAGSSEGKAYWITGGAGTGKSAIAVSLVRELEARETPTLVASFFCKEGDAQRANADLVIPTIAWKLCCLDSDSRTSISKALKTFSAKGYNLFLASPEAQLCLFEALPVCAALSRPVILVDALDECGDVASRKQLLNALAKAGSSLASRAVFVVVSRETDDIAQTLRQKFHLLVDLSTHLHTTETGHDVRKFLKDELTAIAANQHRDSEDWPTSNDLDKLVNLSGGLFIWARIVCGFVNHIKCYQRLNEILRGGDDGDLVAKIYSRVLASALDDEPGKVPDDVALLCSVLGHLICTLDPLPPSALSELSGVDLNIVKGFLHRLRPLLMSRTSIDDPIQVIHASLPRYLVSDAAGLFKVSSEEWNLHLARRCLQIMLASEDGLRFNVFNLSDSTTPIVVHPNLASLRFRMRTSMWYACLQWTGHVDRRRSALPTGIVDQIGIFFEQRFFYWLEALSVAGAVHDTIGALNKLSHRFLGDSTLVANVSEASAFMRTYREPIALSPAHIYLSAIPMAQKCSTIAREFVGRVPNILPRVVIGLPETWLACTLGISFSNEVKCVTFVDQRVLTICSDGRFSSHDCNTGKLIASSCFQYQNLALVEVADLSPDGLRAATVYDDDACDPCVAVWTTEDARDLQLPFGLPLQWQPTILCFSADSRLLACANGVDEAHIWDVSTGQCIWYALRPDDDSGFSGHITFSRKDLRFFTSNSCGLSIWDITPDLKVVKEAKLGLDYVRERGEHLNRRLCFSPNESLFAVGIGFMPYEVLIIDVKSGVTLQTIILRTSAGESCLDRPTDSELCFSADGTCIGVTRYKSFDVVNLKSGRIVFSVATHTTNQFHSSTAYAAFASGGAHFAATVDYDRLHIWTSDRMDLEVPDPLNTISGANSHDLSAVSDSGVLLAQTKWKRPYFQKPPERFGLRVLNCKDGTNYSIPLPSRKLPWQSTELVVCFNISSDGRRIAIGTTICVRIWDVLARTFIAKVDQKAVALALSSNGERLAVVSFNHDMPIVHRPHSRVNVYLIIAAQDWTTVTVAFPPSHELWSIKNTNDSFNAVSFSNDDKLLALSLTYGDIDLYDAQDGHRRWSSRTPEQADNCLDFCKAGNLFIKSFYQEHVDLEWENARINRNKLCMVELDDGDISVLETPNWANLTLARNGAWVYRTTKSDYTLSRLFWIPEELRARYLAQFNASERILAAAEVVVYFPVDDPWNELCSAMDKSASSPSPQVLIHLRTSTKWQPIVVWLMTF